MHTGTPLGGDFMAPAAPTGLTPSAPADSIALAWNANTESTSRATTCTVDDDRRCRPPAAHQRGGAETRARRTSTPPPRPGITYNYVVAGRSTGRTTSRWPRPRLPARSGVGRNRRRAAQRVESVRDVRRRAGAQRQTFTVELWFRRTGAGVGTSTGTGGIANAIPLITRGAPTRRRRRTSTSTGS